MTDVEIPDEAYADMSSWAAFCAKLAKEIPGREFPEPLLTKIRLGWDRMIKEANMGQLKDFKWWKIDVNSDKHLRVLQMTDESWERFCHDDGGMRSLISESLGDLHYPAGKSICVGTAWAEKFAPDGTFLGWSVIRLGSAHQCAFITRISMPGGYPALVIDNPTLNRLKNRMNNQPPTGEQHA